MGKGKNEFLIRFGLGVAAGSGQGRIDTAAILAQGTCYVYRVELMHVTKNFSLP